MQYNHKWQFVRLSKRGPFWDLIENDSGLFFPIVRNSNTCQGAICGKNDARQKVGRRGNTCEDGNEELFSVLFGKNSADS